MILQVFLLFACLSLLAMGGGSAIIPDMFRETVEVRHWLTARQFVDFYALTQMTPGPGMMLVTLIGYQAAAIPGALTAAVAMFGPTSLLALAVRNGWDRLLQSRWRSVLERTTRPLAVGTMLASAALVGGATNHAPADWGITAGAALCIASGRLGILPTMLGAGLLGGWLGK